MPPCPTSSVATTPTAVPTVRGGGSRFLSGPSRDLVRGDNFRSRPPAPLSAIWSARNHRPQMLPQPRPPPLLPCPSQQSQPPQLSSSSWGSSGSRRSRSGWSSSGRCPQAAAGGPAAAQAAARARGLVRAARRGAPPPSRAPPRRLPLRGDALARGAVSRSARSTEATSSSAASPLPWPRSRRQRPCCVCDV